MDIRKPFLKSFTVKELIQFIDHYIEHRELLHVPGHTWEVCDLVARFLGFGYSRRWAEDEIAVLSHRSALKKHQSYSLCARHMTASGKRITLACARMLKPLKKGCRHMEHL